MLKFAKIIGGVVIVLTLIAGLILWRARSRRLLPPASSNNQRQETAVKTQQAILKTLADWRQTDHDLDGLSDADETKYHTDPNKSDTDGDGLLDKDEIQIYKTDPLKFDTYNLGISDGWGARRHKILPDGKVQR